MNKNIKIALMLGSVSMALGCAVGINNLTNKSAEPVSAATTSGRIIYPDSASNLTYTWYRSSNPSNYDGFADVGGFSVGANSTSGLKLNNGGEGFNLNYSTSKKEQFYVQTQSQMNYCYAIYQPFYFKKTIRAHTILSERYIFTVDITGSSTGLKSAEIFYFGGVDNDSETTTTMPERFWFTSGDTTTTKTGCPNSLGRYGMTKASGTSDISTDLITVSNNTDDDKTFYFHFGLFAYKQKTDNAQSMKVNVTHSGIAGGIYNSTVTANGNMYLDLASAIADYNSKDNSELTLIENQTLPSDITLSSNGGHVYLNKKNLLCNNYKINIEGSTTFHGYGDIRGTGDQMLNIDTPDITVELDGEVDAFNSGANTLYMGSNAVGSKFIVNSEAKLRNTNSNTNSSVVSL